MNFSFDSDPRMISFKRKIGYDEAIMNEKRDGLIAIDFLKLEAPSFATQWPDENGWMVNKREYSLFRWRTKATHAALGIVAVVHENYEDAQEWFLFKAHSSNMEELPWIACSKKIGTVCAQATGKRMVFFAYKNVMIEVVLMSREPGHEDFALVLAEWLFDALKAAPLKPMPR